jgi:hypothetical protein
MSPSQIIASLNSLGIGDVALIRARLDEAREACLRMNQHELAARLEEAAAALRQADMRTYRKRVETVVARLGHLR